MDGCEVCWRSGSRAEDGGGGDGGLAFSVGSVGKADEGVRKVDEGVMGEDSCARGELAGGVEIEGRVGGVALEGTGSETGSSRGACWADGWEEIGGGSISMLSLKPE
jgi:hypothetical protein